MTAATGTHQQADIFERARNYERRELIEQAREHDMLPYFRRMESQAAPVLPMEGRERLMLGSNNYLGLTGHPRVQAAAHDALSHYGTALTGSRLQNGTVPLHLELEREIADWMGTEDALVYTTGYLANLGAISALVGPKDTVVVDSADHASILDGCKLSGARLRPFRHGHVDKLDAMLDRAAQDGGGTFVVMNTVFSMEGGIIDLPGVVETVKAHGARLMLDEAHAIGVLGVRGAGLAELHGLEDQVDLRMGTFSKSLASCGGYIAGPADVIDYLRFHSRAFLFTVSAVPPAIAAALEAIRIIRSAEGEQLLARVLDNATYLHRGIVELGLRTVDPITLPDGRQFVTPIIPVIGGDEITTGMLWKALWDAGLYANLAVYPAVPPGAALIRNSVMATHEREHLDRTLEIYARMAEQFPSIRKES